MGRRSQNFHVGGIYPFTNSGHTRNALKYQLKTLIIHNSNEDRAMQRRKIRGPAHAGSVWERTSEGSEAQAVLEIKQDCRMR